jgi:hypothetical protein
VRCSLVARARGGAATQPVVLTSAVARPLRKHATKALLAFKARWAGGSVPGGVGSDWPMTGIVTPLFPLYLQYFYNSCYSTNQIQGVQLQI